MRWRDALHEGVRNEFTRHPRRVLVLLLVRVLVGDCNVAPEDRDVDDPVAGAGQIHGSPEARAQFGRLLALGLHDAVCLFEQAPKSRRWWDGRHLAFRKNQGLRINPILASEPLRPRGAACTIDQAPRRHAHPSDPATGVAALHESHPRWRRANRRSPAGAQGVA